MGLCDKRIKCTYHHGMEILDPEWDHFLTLLSREPVVSRAARQAGLTPSAVYARRARDVDFRAAWDEALAEGTDGILAEVHRRAVTGYLEPQTYQGILTGAYIRKYSDPLLAILAKALLPKLFNPASKVELKGEVQVVELTPAEKAIRISELMAIAAERRALE